MLEFWFGIRRCRRRPSCESPDFARWRKFRLSYVLRMGAGLNAVLSVFQDPPSNGAGADRGLPNESHRIHSITMPVVVAALDLIRLPPPLAVRRLFLRVMLSACSIQKSPKVATG